MNFDEVLFPRYVKVKESIEDLMKVIKFDEVTNDGIDRVLSALLQLVDDNDDKTVEEKKIAIADAMYNGNIFKHYFNEEDLDRAIDILSNTVLLNNEERLLYIVNFYMPNDVNFTSVYNKFNKDVKKIAEYYGLTSDDAYNFIYARATELSKFYDMYKSEKDRQKRINETYVLAAMQDATEEPTKENIARATELLSGITNADLKETLEQQLFELRETIEPLENVDETLEESVITNEVESIPEVIEENNNEFGDFMENYENQELTQDLKETEEIISNSEESNDDIVEETFEVTEPKYLEEVLKEEPIRAEENVGKDVMHSLQSLVTSARGNARRVEQLSLDLEDKNKQIAELQDSIDNKDQELLIKNQQLDAKDSELRNKNNLVEEQAARIFLLETEIKEKDGIIESNSRVITSKNEEISTLTHSLNSYKTSLAEIQIFLANAGPSVEVQENTRKIA